MAPAAYLASTVLMGTLALVVFVAVAVGRDWRHYTPRLSRPEGGLLARLARDGRVWILAFVALVVAATAGTLATLGGGSTTVLFGGAGAIVLAFLLVGVYAVGRSRGHPHSYAVGEAIAALGAVFLLALTGWLLTSFGA